MTTAVKENRRLLPRATVGRKRERHPDRNTPEGQIALWLAHHLARKGMNHKEFADAIGYGRTTVFDWLAGDTAPSVKAWPGIAKTLGLKDWRKVIPPDSFIESI
jgi:DNA-binding XRE family transcriptional regulator